MAVTSTNVLAPSAPELNVQAPVHRPFRIVHLVSSLLVGGMEQFVLRIAFEQQKLGYQVSVVALRGGPLEAEAVGMGLPVHVLGGGGSVLRVLRCMNVMARLRPEIINCHNPSSLHYAALGRRFGKPKVLLIRHGQARNLVKENHWREIDAVIAVSEAAAEIMRGERADMAHKVMVVRNGINISKPARSRAAIRQELGLDDRLTGIMVARIDGMKGHDTLVKSLSSIPASAGDFTVLIVGDGAERPRIEALCTELNVGADRIRFLGFRKDVTDLLAASDFFLLPSLSEGLPLSVLEAMSQSLPVIATAVGGVPEVVADGVHGLLVPVEDWNALADAMVRIVGSAELRSQMGRAGFNRVVEEFSFDHMLEEYAGIYSRLLPAG